MGLLAYDAPIQIPPGYGGLLPSLRLACSSGSGNSAVGIRWSLGLPRIQRMTSRGLPEDDASDPFAAGGGDGVSAPP